MTADFAIFYYAALALLSGQSPYSVPGFFNPVWTLIPIIPLTLLPIDTARGVYVVLTVLGILLALCLLRLKPLYIVAIVLFSPVVWLNVCYANVDWMVLLGAALPVRFGIWLFALKPQVSIGSLSNLAIQSRTRRLVIIAGAALIANYAIFGLPNLAFKSGLNSWSADLFPVALPLGLFLLYRAIRSHNDALALASGAFLAPYYGITSYLALSPLALTWKRLAVVIVLTWAVFLVWRSRI